MGLKKKRSKKRWHFFETRPKWKLLQVVGEPKIDGWIALHPKGDLVQSWGLVHSSLFIFSSQTELHQLKTYLIFMRIRTLNGGQFWEFRSCTQLSTSQPVPHSLKAHKRALLLALILHIIHFLDHVQNFTFGHESLSKTPFAI
jgi:hypothetical protein